MNGKPAEQSHFMRPSGNTAAQAQHMSPPQPPTMQIPESPLASVPSQVNYLSEREQRDADLQVYWSAWMSDVQKNSSVYKHVFVLLVSWHPECDDMSVGNEVTRLQKVFEDSYHYHVSNFLIDSRKATTPQAQVNFEVAKFVHDNDKEDSLFIVYYAGHGSPGKSPGELKMSGRRRRNTSGSNEWNHITWNLAESNLKTTQADVFLIFDCCHASDLGRESIFNSRCFEYLAASTSYYTPSPGKRSFTSGLIWALTELANPGSPSPPHSQPTARMFTTSKLAAKICEAPDFPTDQKPSLTTRDMDAYQRIVLAPLPFQGDPIPAVVDDDEDDIKPTPECLDLSFFFNTKQDPRELKKLADHLIKFMKFDDTSLYKVQWSGIRPAAHSKFRAVVNEMIARTVRRRKLSTSNVPPSSLGGGGVSQPGGYATSDGLLTPTSVTEHTPLLHDPFPRINEEDSPKSFLNRLFPSLRKFWLPKIEVEGPVDDQLPSITQRPRARKGGFLLTRIRNMFNRLTPLLRIRL